MIIDSNSINSPASQSRATENTGARPAVDNSTASKPVARNLNGERDSVSLSVEAQTMGKLANEIAEQPEVDEAKVAAVKAAISEGRYRIDSQTIAERMLAQDQLLD